MTFYRIYTGPMTGGKTSRLLADLDRFRYQKKSVVAFKPEIDNRFDAQHIVSHGGWKAPSHMVKTGLDVLDHLSKLDKMPDVVAVDEAFMIKGIADALQWLFRCGMNIVVATLDLSSSCVPFAEVQKMLPWATHIEKCPAVCVNCSRDAFYTYRRVGADDEIVVGGLEIYEARCHACHPFIERTKSPSANE